MNTCYFGGFIVVKSDEKVYGRGTMKFLKKIVTGSFIITLVSFVGGFCTRPMMAEAHFFEMAMEEMAGAILLSQDCVSSSADEASYSINVCAIDCITTVPQVINTKKVGVDHILQISLIDPFSVSHLRGSFSDGLSVKGDVFGISPPAPDILSSVFKRE